MALDWAEIHQLKLTFIVSAGADGTVKLWKRNVSCLARPISSGIDQRPAYIANFFFLCWNALGVRWCH